jgi:hypothetical protein
MRRAWVRSLVILCWVAMMGWLLRYEAYPEYFTNAPGGYQGLFSKEILIMDSWMRILFQGAPIGFSHSTMELDEADPTARHVVRNLVSVRMNLMGLEQKIYVDTEVRLDDEYNLQRFAFSLSAPDYKLKIKGERARGDDFSVVITTGASRQTTTVTVPKDVVLYSPMTEMAMKRLRPGQSMTIRALDPTTLSTAPITIKALRQEAFTLGETTYEATVLGTDYHGMEVLSWIDRDGRLLKQDTPFGWSMETCSMDEAFAALAASGQARDLLSGMAVPCAGTIRNPRESERLRLRLSGVVFGESDLLSPRQTVEERTDDHLILTVRSAARTDAPAADVDEDALRPYLQPSLSIQCDHEEIVAQAASITRGLTAPAEKAMAIFDWVHDNVRKEMTVSLPSALDVLRTMRGDCNEHTYLYVALARAAGLPCSIRVGLAYQDGAFYYHAWPSVFIGTWHECDPTWGQRGVDATHIAVVEGELANQLELVKIMGKLRIEVLEQ